MPEYPVWIGIDWSEKVQVWCAIDDRGNVLERGRFRETPDEFGAFLGKLISWQDPDTGDMPMICIERGHGLLVSNLLQNGVPVYAVNPKALKRWKDAFGQSGKKDDAFDAEVLANFLRQQPPHMRRPTPDVTDLGAALYQLGRAHQNQVWRVQRTALELRTALTMSFPAALALWTASTLTTSTARAILDAAPTPSRARALTPMKMRTLLRKAGRSRYIDRDVDKFKAAFRVVHLDLPPEQEQAFGYQVQALVRNLTAAVEAEQMLREQLEAAIERHPLWTVLDSVTGVGKVTAARLLGEIGDDPNRFANARALRNYAGTSPITDWSSETGKVKRRKVKNNRLTHAAYLWSMAAMGNDPLAHFYYDKLRGPVVWDSQLRRERRAKRHQAALRQMGNRMMGCLWHCLVTGEAWDNAKAFQSVYDDYLAHVADNAPTAPLDAAEDDDRDAALVAEVEAANQLHDDDTEDLNEDEVAGDSKTDRHVAEPA